MYFDPVQVVHGNLVDKGLAGDFDVIVQGCNCFHVMGAGLAREIREKIPIAYTVDKLTAIGDTSKLGKFSVCQVLGNTGKLLTIINAYTQWKPNPPVNYEAIEEVFTNIGILYKNSHVAYPRIGAGLAGGDWSIIQPLIDKGLSGVYKQTLVEYLP